MYAIQTFVGRLIPGGYLTGSHRFETHEEAAREMASIDWAVKRINPDIRWMIRRVVKV